MLKALTIIAAVAAATASVAGPARLSDVQFLQAARCEGLMTSSALGTGDAAGIQALVKAQRQGRVEYIYDRADQSRADAQRQARRADTDQKAKLIAERDSVCHSLLGVGVARTAGESPAPTTN